MALFVLTESNSIANHFLAQLRQKEIQKDSMRFRKNLERLGEIIAYEISKTFQYENNEIESSLGTAIHPIASHQVVIAVVLRAGLPFYQGFLNYFDNAESAFIAAYRGIQDENHSFQIKMDYMAAPSIENKTLILVDPMLATGRSLLEAYQSLLRHGKPSAINIASVIASSEGINFIQKNIPEHSLWTATVDEHLNNKSYIVPGLGDAGDLSFGTKL